MTRRITRFCGIDIGKNKHVACVLDADGQTLARSQSFTNDAEGYELLLQRIGTIAKPPQLLVGMEATGHYWYPLHDFLTRRGYSVAVLNPIQTAQQARKAIRKSKTDKVDARHIAMLLKNGEHRPAHLPGERAMTCRQLTRLDYALAKQSARTKQLLRSRLHPVWPEFDTLFADPWCATAQALLRAAPTPQDVLAAHPEELTELLRKTSRGRVGPDRATRILQSAAHSVGMRRGLGAARIGIRTLLDQLDALQPVRRKLRMEIEQLAVQLPPCILTLPGTNAFRAVSLFGEVDPIDSFRTPGQLVAFAGLDPTVFQSGQFNAGRRRLSKRGSPFLRRTLWMMAAVALQSEGELRQYYFRRRRAAQHHLAAVTAVAGKLCRIAWRIMTDRRDYVPDGRSLATQIRES